MHAGYAAEAESVDAVQDMLSRAYLPLRLEPVEPQHFRADIALRRVGRITLGRVAYGGEIWVQTAELSNFHLDVTVTGATRSRAGSDREVHTGPGDASVFSPEQSARLWCAPGTVQWAMMFDAELVNEELTNLLGRMPNRRVEFIDRVSGGENHLAEFTQALRLLETVADDAFLAGNPLLARRLEQAAVTTLLLTCEHTYSDELQQRAARMPTRLARYAVDMLHSDPGREWSVGEVARECGVSVRSLYEGFRDLTGTSPMNYLQQLRMDSAHDMLLHGDGELTVAAVAHRWGFAHLGRFAAGYRKRYGESPSETLRRDR